MQGTQVQALVREDPRCRRSTKPVAHNYWACTLDPGSQNYWAPVPQLQKPTRNEDPTQQEKKDDTGQVIKGKIVCHKSCWWCVSLMWPEENGIFISVCIFRPKPHNSRPTIRKHQKTNRQTNWATKYLTSPPQNFQGIKTQRRLRNVTAQRRLGQKKDVRGTLGKF